MQFTFLNKHERKEKKRQKIIDLCNKIEKEPMKVFLWFPKKIGTKLIWLETVIKTAKWCYYGHDLRKTNPDYSHWWEIRYINPKEKT